MSPVAETLITTLTKSLAGSLVKAASRRLRHRLEDLDQAQALERCCQAGVVAMVATSLSTDQAEQQLLQDIFREFFTGEETGDDVGKEITQLIRGHRLDLEAMAELFAAAGFEAETLPGVDLHGALRAFEKAFVIAAIEESAFQGEIEVGVLLNQLDVLRQIRGDLKGLVAFLTTARPGSVEVVGRGRVEIIPLMVDRYLLDGWEDGLAADLRSRLPADFTGWEHNNAKFEEQIERVAKALRAEGRGRRSHES